MNMNLEIEKLNSVKVESETFYRLTDSHSLATIYYSYSITN